MYFFFRIFALIVFALLPLVPAMVLFIVLKDPIKAQVEGPLLGLGVSLSGPTALYFLLLHYLRRLYKDILPKHMVDMQCKQKDIHNTCKLLCGKWDFVTRHRNDDESTTTTKGTANICMGDKGDMNIHGHWLDDKGEVAGSWTADDLIVDTDKLILMFQVPSPSGQETTGLVRLKLHYESEKRDLLKLTGMWGVLGESIRGNSTWERAQA